MTGPLSTLPGVRQTVPFKTARDIAELACDLTDKAVYWRERALKAEARLAALHHPAETGR